LLNLGSIRPKFNGRGQTSSVASAEVATGSACYESTMREQERTVRDGLTTKFLLKVPMEQSIVHVFIRHTV